MTLLKMKLPEPLLKVDFKDSEDGHFYSVDGKDMMLPGVTTILRILGKPALIPWAAKKAAEALWDRLEKEEGGIFGAKKEEVVKWAAGAPNRERDTAGAKGTDVHEAVEKYLNGETVELEQGPVRDSFENFKNFFLWKDMELIAGDTPLVSLDMGYGGRMDGLFIDEKQRLVLVDFKTSKGVYADHFVQIGGYSLALLETYGIRPNRCGVVHIRPDKCEWHEGDVSLGEQAFRRTVEIYHLMKKIEAQMEATHVGER